MRAIRIDRSKPLAEQPHTGHNRYHPDIEPVLEVAEGEEVVLETRDAIDGQLSSTATEAAFANLNAGAIHPLTGPVFVRGVKLATCLRSSSSTSHPSRLASAALSRGSASCATS